LVNLRILPGRFWLIFELILVSAGWPLVALARPGAAVFSAAGFGLTIALGREGFCFCTGSFC
jgi:hypothetical protein